MPPKPFPFALGVGTDICRVARLVHVANDAVRLNLWAKRVFTRLEWPMVYERLAVGLDVAGPDDKQKLDLPWINIPGQDAASRSPQMKKLQFLAGRWAAKEAAIKAHRHRRLSMSEISILAENQMLGKGIHALVDPPAKMVAMDESVAQIRGLRGYGDNYSKSRRADSISGPCVYGAMHNGKFQETEPSAGKRFPVRRLKIKAAERQVAEVSISHDGDYAVAVCMAVDEIPVDPSGQSLIIDDGSSNSIHEPEWGDEGWLTKDDLCNEGDGKRGLVH